jgi:hypothetical protein
MVAKTRAAGAFFGLVSGMMLVGIVSFTWPSVSYLWHNVIGAVTVLGVGMVLSAVWPGRAEAGA